MSVREYLKRMKAIQKNILDFIEKDSFSEEDRQQLFIFFENQKIANNISEIEEILLLISKISKYHHRTPDFFSKIKEILIFFKDSMKKNFTNYNLFNIFSDNKQILLFLFEEKLIIPDYSISCVISNEKFKSKFYPNFFYPEIHDFLNEKLRLEVEKTNNEYNYDFDEFQKLRKIGQNDSYVCQLIQKDLCNDFISYVNKSDISLLSTVVTPSIFETNEFLIKHHPTLIEYSAFFGSIQIFKYLYLNNVELNSSIWIYAIHGQNTDLIHFLEEKQIKPPNNSFMTCFIESIKCHQNKIANYFKKNFLNQNEFNEKLLYKTCIQSRNYKFSPDDLKINYDVFYYLCKNNYLTLVDLFLKAKKLDLNECYSKHISNHFFSL
ncbi:hypothetical protein M9Y10_028759 [Tritrichomonas musculus]|uniref:DUF3447 domain-containing protein n=1 Tax=Tritrichomonas musculus TaxID=1915356 RepID=A0ABR2KLD2_9EUKA